MLTDGAIVANDGAIYFWSNIFANNASSGNDTRKLSASGSLSSYGYNVYRTTSVAVGTNDVGKYIHYDLQLH